MNILLERGALSCIGAWSGNANRGWSVERWVCVERGAVKLNSLGAWNEDAKIGQSAENPERAPKAVCQNKVFIYLLDKHDSEDHQID